MDKFPSLWPDGHDLFQDNEFRLFPVLLPSSKTETEMYIKAIKRYESNAICSDMINDLLERRRQDFMNTWRNGMISKFTACSNVIAKEISELYNSDPLSFKSWQYDFLDKTFTRLLKTNGDCPPELVGDLVSKSLNLLRSDQVLINLLVISDDNFVEAILTRLIEMSLSETVARYGLDRPYEDPKKIKKIRKLLIRATSAASIAQTAAKIWGWRNANERVPLPPPIAAPSKLASENYYVYVCGSGRNSKKVLKSTSSISTSFKDGAIPLPKVFMPFQSKLSSEPLELDKLGTSEMGALVYNEHVGAVQETTPGTLSTAQVPVSTDSENSDAPEKVPPKSFKKRSSEKILRPGRGRPPKNATIVRTIRGTLDRRIHKLKTPKETTRRVQRPRNIHRSKGMHDRDDEGHVEHSDEPNEDNVETPHNGPIHDSSLDPQQVPLEQIEEHLEEEMVRIEKNVQESPSHMAEPPDLTSEPTSILDLFSGATSCDKNDEQAPKDGCRVSEVKDDGVSIDYEENDQEDVKRNVESEKNGQENEKKKRTEETVWDMVQKHHRTRGTVKKPKVVEQNAKNTYDEFVGNEMENLIREHSHVSEHVPSSQTEPYADAYKKPKSLKWSIADTKRFYNAIEMFGSDLMLVRAFLSEFTDRQIYDKFKLEERKNPQLVKNALKIHRNISLGQYELKHGKIDVNTHYDPNKDPFLTDDAPTKKNTLSLNHEQKPIEIAGETPQVGDILNLFM